MINVITDLIQSFSIIMLATMAFFLVRRVHRLDTRLDVQKITEEYREAHNQLHQEPQPVCGCGHHECFHDETGCGKIDTWQPYSGLADTDTYKNPCGCKRYTGPEVLPTVIP